MRTILSAALAATAACATTAAGDEPEQVVGVEGSCSAEALADLAGQAATQELGSEALRRSGARALRWIRPGDAVTMDYRTDRLNVHLDAQGRVERFACG